MESYHEDEVDPDERLILPIVIFGNRVSREKVFTAVPRALLQYLDQENNDLGLMDEQTFLEWLSDGSQIELRYSPKKYHDEENDDSLVSFIAQGVNMTIEPVTTPDKFSDDVNSFSAYFEGDNPVNEEDWSISEDDALDPFSVPLASVVISPLCHEEDKDILDQICFNVSSIFFSLSDTGKDEWKDNGFRVEVFLEDAIRVSSNSRVMNTVEETGMISSTAFWIE